MPDPSATHRAIEAVWRIESARVIAGLARTLRGDVELAEESAQAALLAALEQWPESGIPENAGAWLMAAARNKAIDAVRRRQRFKLIREDLTRDLEARQSGARADPGLAAAGRAIDGEVEDDLLRLFFMACHPALPSEARSALTLRLLGGLTTDEIARAFLASEPTIAQRIVRAKRTLVEAKTPFEVPVGPELQARLSSVLEVIYLLFNEGYAATSGDDWMRPALCEEALRIGRILSGLMPREPEVHGLAALMEIQASRAAARTDPSGKPILLLDQDRTRWDQLLIRRGLAALETAASLSPSPGQYELQASIAACHARARTAAETDWKEIARLYGELARATPSPVVELNRAVAVGMASGPQAGLDILDGLADAASLGSYHLLPCVRGDLLSRLGRHHEARREFERGAALTRNAREREVILQRARECEAKASDGMRNQLNGK